MLSNFGTTELVIVALVMFFMLGGRKMPELAKGIGDSVKEFRKATREEQ